MKSIVMHTSQTVAKLKGVGPAEAHDVLRVDLRRVIHNKLPRVSRTQDRILGCKLSARSKGQRARQRQQVPLNSRKRPRLDHQQNDQRSDLGPVAIS